MEPATEADGDDPAFVAEGSITGIRLGLASNEEIVKAQPVNEEFPLKHPSQLSGNPALGLPLQFGRCCDSCGATDLAKCEGHFGFIKLPVSIYHPSHVAELTNILNMICFSCLQFKNLQQKQKSAGKESNFRACPHCQDLPPLRIAKVKKNNGAISLELRVPARKEVEEGFWSFLDEYGFHTKGSSRCRRLFPEEVQKIITKIPQETRRQLAARGYILQDGFVMSNLSVPPNCLRAFNVLDETLMCTPDASTSLLRKVLRKVHEINSSRVGPPTFSEHEEEADDLQAAIADYIKLTGSAKGPRDVTFGSQPVAKQWQQKMKSLFISKNSSFSCRAVITGDPYIPFNVVGLPDEVARRMSVQERVTDHNVAQLQGMMNKGLCLTYEDANSITYSLDVGPANKKRIILKVGETVDRRILDGDIVFLNRPPSTDKHSVQALYAQVHTDHTIKINPFICGPLGADFDGDCVHIFFPRSVSARAEATELFTVENQLVSSHNGKLNFQLKNDCLLAIKKMSGGKHSRREANNLMNAMFVGGMIPKKRLSGRPKWSFNEILETLLPEEDKVLVRDLVTGTVTLSSVLSTKNPREAIEFLNLLQPLLMESIYTDGFSISLRDFDVTNPVPKIVQNSSLDIDKFREPIVDFITRSSDLSFLVDPKSGSAMNKVVEQIGFLGHQLQREGRLYSSSLVEDCLSKSESKCGSNTNGFIRSSFYNGLNPYEDLLHSISGYHAYRTTQMIMLIVMAYAVLPTKETFLHLLPGDSRVQEANIIWVEPQATCWIQNSDPEPKGELALEITMDITSTGESGYAWGTAMDACIPVMDLIDTTRSVPYSIQQVRQVCGISYAFGRVIQHLSKAVGMVTKSVLKEHLTTVASSMTCTGNLHGFNSYGYKATFQSLKIQAPFMKATVSRPMHCFEEGAEKVHSDHLDNVVSTCSWGNRAAIGTGSSFEIQWNDPNQWAGSGNLGGYGLYDLLTAVESTGAIEDNRIVPLGSCLYDVDNLQEDETEEDEVLLLGGNSPMSWTDKPKVDLLLHDLQGRTERQHETRQINSNWSPAANWQHNKHTGKVYRRQPNSNWSSDATQQDGNLSWNQAIVAGPQNFAITGPSSSGGWNRKPGNLGRGGGRGAVWKSEESHRGGSNSRWKAQRTNTTGTQNFPISGPPNSGGWNMRTSNLGPGGGRGAAWKSSGPNHGGKNSRNQKAQSYNNIGQRGSSNFTPEEQQIHAQVDPIQKEVKRIIRDSRYSS